MQNLNEQQLKAVTISDGPMLILAGAGSGKTKVLTSKIAHLVATKKAYPENILAVTFTNKAASEMKQRISALAQSQVYFPWIGTFHSVCVKMLKQDGFHLGYSRYFTIYDSADQLKLVRDILKKIKANTDKISDKAVLSAISSAKNELLGYEDFYLNGDTPYSNAVNQAYPLYQKALKDNNAMDFDDLIMQTVVLFQNYPEVLAKYQALYKYILIDEYQDTNHAQYMLSKLLALKNQNVTVVGDDAQSIYSFRGATIRNILEFEKDYPDTVIIKLEQNYRSTKTILDASNTVISLNKRQKKKTLWTNNDDGEKIVVYKARDERDEADWIANQAIELVRDGVEPNEIAVIYRTNAQSRNIEEYMLRKNIDYQIVGGVRFYDRKEIKDAIAYLNIFHNPQDQLSLGRIINMPKRGIGPKSIENMQQMANAFNKSLLDWLCTSSSLPSSKGIIEFATFAKAAQQKASKADAKELLEFILDKSGYIKMLDDGDPENEGRLENLRELLTLADRFSGLPARESLEQFLNEVSLIQEQTSDKGEHVQRVSLMSIHAAKGLEFEHLFVCGMEEGIFPHSRAYTDPLEMEEERRLAYVALTRAKKQLYLTHADTRAYFGSSSSNVMSRFIGDIPQHLLEVKAHGSNSFAAFSGWSLVDEVSDDTWQAEMPQLSAGDKVKHDSFGIGLVTKINEQYVTVSFARGVKELSLDYARLTKV